MVCDRTLSSDTTDPRAWINTVLVDTSSGGRTVIVNQTLRPTLNVRVAGVVSDTPAGGGPSLLRALGIPSTGRGIAGLNDLNWPLGWKIREIFLQPLLSDNLKLTWLLATRKRISNKTILTNTIGIMISHNTVGIPATETGAGVNTLLIFASSVSGTVNIVETFWPAVGRKPSHAGKTRAVTSCVPPYWGTGIRTAGVWLAGIICLHRQYCWNRTVGATCF